jgi:hypothetical protein
VQVTQHVVVPALRPTVLVLQDSAGASGITGKKQENVVLEIKEGIHRDPEGYGGNTVVRVESEAGEAAV